MAVAQSVVLALVLARRIRGYIRFPNVPSLSKGGQIQNQELLGLFSVKRIKWDWRPPKLDLGYIAFMPGQPKWPEPCFDHSRIGQYDNEPLPHLVPVYLELIRNRVANLLAGVPRAAGESRRFAELTPLLPCRQMTIGLLHYRPN